MKVNRDTLGATDAIQQPTSEQVLVGVILDVRDWNAIIDHLDIYIAALATRGLPRAAGSIRRLRRILGDAYDEAIGP